MTLQGRSMNNDAYVLIAYGSVYTQTQNVGVRLRSNVYMLYISMYSYYIYIDIIT